MRSYRVVQFYYFSVTIKPPPWCLISFPANINSSSCLHTNKLLTCASICSSFLSAPKERPPCSLLPVGAFFSSPPSPGAVCSCFSLSSSFCFSVLCVLSSTSHNWPGFDLAFLCLIGQVTHSTTFCFMQYSRSQHSIRIWNASQSPTC